MLLSDKGIAGLKVFEMVQPPRHKINPSPLQGISQGDRGDADELVSEAFQSGGEPSANLHTYR